MHTHCMWSYTHEISTDTYFVPVAAYTHVLDLLLHSSWVFMEINTILKAPYNSINQAQCINLRNLLTQGNIKSCYILQLLLQVIKV